MTKIMIAISLKFKKLMRNHQQNNQVESCAQGMLLIYEKLFPCILSNENLM